MNRSVRTEFLKLCIILTTFMCYVTGCGRKNQTTEPVIERDYTIPTSEQSESAGEEITKIYEYICKTAFKDNEEDSLTTVRNIINQLGEKGYAAVDSENQIDMTQADKVMQFCEQVDAKKTAEVTIIVVSYLNGFTQYDLKTHDGNVDVERSYYKYENGHLDKASADSYPADLWQYTEEGYLIFSGSWPSDESYVLELSDVPECTALRVEPLDEKCRELNRCYILPVSYGKNNMFLINWNENDFGELNFYDLYDIFYQKVNDKAIPYTADDDIRIGAVYQIPKEEFEKVIMKYFSIDSKTLQSKTTYCEEDETYKYKPRGYYEMEYPKIPFSEVTDYTQNSDGTITLNVNAVYPYGNTSRLYTHEVVVRPMSDGGVQYVSNKIITSDNEYDKSWHIDRMSDQEWEATYGKTESITESETTTILNSIDNKEYSLFTTEEKKQLEDMAIEAADKLYDVYKDIQITAIDSFETGIKNFTKEQKVEAIRLLGKAGFVSVSDDVNMENHEIVEEFYSDYQKNNDAMVTIFDVHSDGTIGAITFLHREGKLQTYYVGIEWQEGPIPVIAETLVSNLTKIRLTEKGYFIYVYEEMFEHEGTSRYFRIEPLSDKCRELTQKYISGLSYVNYNMLVTNWDKSNVEDILMPCMFEDIYRIYTGENLKVENDKIPADVYEKIMTTCFPVSIEQLHENCEYDESSNNYKYEMIYAEPFPPFGEVIDYTQNSDGTITLFVDGVWVDFDSDCAFTNKIVVQPFDNGTFRYLSNSVEQNEGMRTWN